MFKRLQQKWGVSTRQFWILFLVFALTGTTTAVLTRYITAFLGMDASTPMVWRIILRVGMLVFGYQVILLGYGALLGQWDFFWKYEKKILVKLGILKKEKITRIAIFASGAGSNARKIIEHLENHSSIQVALIVCNKPGAGVLGIAGEHNIEVLMIERERFLKGDAYIAELRQREIGFIVLAGFLWKVPEKLVTAYPDRIINIHPALLPKYGGKGMYGMKVHEAVIGAGEKESGITIHYVNEHFDEGKPIFQASCVIDENDTPETLALKIHELEHRHFPAIVEKVVKG